MDLLQAMHERHSVRVYENKPIDNVIAEALIRLITTFNAESGLHMQLITNEKRAFGSLKGRYGKFRNVKNYIALVGRKGPDLPELCGYFGEQLVLEAQTLGLKTCWVAGTYRKIPRALSIDRGEKLVAVIAVGYSDENGTPHKSREFNEVSKTIGAMPDWYAKGVEAALLAPNAMNQQQFIFELTADERVRASAALGPYSKLDLGIVKYHFELGSGKDETIWTA